MQAFPSPAHRKGFDTWISSTFVVNLIDKGFGDVEVVVVGAGVVEVVVVGAGIVEVVVLVLGVFPVLNIFSRESSFEEKSALTASRSAWSFFSVGSLAYWTAAILRRRRRADLLGAGLLLDIILDIRLEAFIPSIIEEFTWSVAFDAAAANEVAPMLT
jgi:hypothetical protein